MSTYAASSFVNKDRAKRTFFHFLAYLFALFIALIAFFPFYTMLVSSTHNNYDILNKVNILPGSQFMVNYLRLTQNLNIWRGFLNSTFLTLSTTVLTVYFSALTAYAFSKFRFKGRNFLFTVIIVMMMIPGQIGIIGFYKEVTDMHLLNSYFPLIVPSITNCFGVFFFKQYLDGALPNELLEAAYVDGCREMKMFHKIVLPVMVPALVTQGVMAFIGGWNSYLNPLIILNDSSKMTLPVMIATVKSEYGADYGAQYVGILISIIPLLIIFSFASRTIMDKISVSSSIKG